FNYDVVVKMTMLPTAVPALVRETIALGGSVVAQATGIMLAGFSEADAADALPHLYEPIGRAGGSMTVLKINERPIPSWALPPRDRERDKARQLRRAVKEQFDAKRTLNPGRLVGGA